MIDTLGDRIKLYEDTFNHTIPNRIPVVIRIDGKAFHSWTKKSKCEKPFDKQLVELMGATTKYLCENISGCVCGYCQSDEISLLLINSQTNETQPWFNNRIQKMASISASLATFYFNNNNPKEVKYPAFFDSRVFVVPERDVINYFIWRQRDAMRNSISMLAQSMFSPKQLMKMSSDQKIEMCKTKGIDWNTDLDLSYKLGSLVYKELNPQPLINKVTGEQTYRKYFKIDNQLTLFKYDKDCLISNVLKENGIDLF